MRKPIVFVSHLTRDKESAEVVRKHLGYWGIPTQNVYLSTDGKGPGFRVGETLSAEIAKGLASADVVILVYTYADHNWEYPMWEIGLAESPESTDSRLVVLQCRKDRPKVAEGVNRIVANDPEQVKRLVHQFHRDEGFFRRLGSAYDQEIADEAIDERAKRFFEELEAELQRSARPERKTFRSSLQLELDPAQCSEVANSCLVPREVLVRFLEPRVGEAFGFTVVAGEEKSWQELMDEISARGRDKWTRSLGIAVACAVGDKIFHAGLPLFRGLDEREYRPVLAAMDKYPDGTRRFVLELVETSGVDSSRPEGALGDLLGIARLAGRFQWGFLEVFRGEVQGVSPEAEGKAGGVFKRLSAALYKLSAESDDEDLLTEERLTSAFGRSTARKRAIELATDWRSARAGVLGSAEAREIESLRTHLSKASEINKELMVVLHRRLQRVLEREFS